MQLNLFDLPELAAKRPVGRPGFRLTVENQRLVESMIKGGWTQPEICEAIGASPKTFRRLFSGTAAFVSRWGERKDNRKEKS